MKKYEAPKLQMIAKNDADIICTSGDLFFPIIPVVNEEGNTSEM